MGLRTAYFDCLSGASGNMVLGAMLDAGASPDSVNAAIRALGLDTNARLKIEPCTRGGIRATHVTVEVLRPQSWARLADIDRLIADAPLDEGVRERSRLAFRLLGDAEARAHNVEVDEVRLHETGAIDAVVDVVGSFAAAESLGVEVFQCSPLPYCVGETTSAHGVIPLPAPATARILETVGAPTFRRDGDHELVTPTGAAIIAACATFESPRMDLECEGFGAGTAELPWPNVLRLAIGDVEVMDDANAPLLSPPTPATAGASPGLDQDIVSVLETNIDDMAANLLAELPRSLLAAGALDAFLTPVLMKKGRAAHLLTVVCPPSEAETFAARIIRDSSTLGVRVREERRYIAGRRVEQMAHEFGSVGVKLKLVNGQVVDAVPEHDDVARLAEANSLPLMEAHRRLAAAARRRYLEDGE